MLEIEKLSEREIMFLISKYEKMYAIEGEVVNYDDKALKKSLEEKGFIEKDDITSEGNEILDNFWPEVSDLIKLEADRYEERYQALQAVREKTGLPYTVLLYMFAILDLAL